MIDVHAVNKKKKKKYIDSIIWFLRTFNHLTCTLQTKTQKFNQPITSTPHLIWFLFGIILRYIDSYSPTSTLFCLFILQFVIKGKASAEELELLQTQPFCPPSLVQLLFYFTSVCTTKDRKFYVNVSFFALLINLRL